MSTLLSAHCLTMHPVLSQGPEQPVSRIAERMKGNKWDVDAIGFGVRGYANGTATRRFEGDFSEPARL